MWSDAGADVLERFAEIRGPEWDQLAEHTVGEAMTPSLCSVAPFVDIYTAAEYMVRAGVHRLIVLDDGRVVGVLSSMDIVRAVAQQRLVAAGPEVRSSPRAQADVRR
jgi:signal-transduction protein with cAMP-binding, CBS, and nucleotidyltransferase domain